jgi:hypothetical protein
MIAILRRGQNRCWQHSARKCGNRTAKTSEKRQAAHESVSSILDYILPQLSC